MRRLIVLLFVLPALLAACAGDDQSAEVAQLQSDVEALRAEVAYLSGELEIADAERSRLRDDLSEVRADLDRQAAAAAAAAAPSAAAADDTDTADTAPASDEFRAYFQQVEEVLLGATAISEEIVAKIDAVARTGDLDATKTLFRDLARVLEDAVAKAAGLEPPPALASLHGEHVAAQEGFAQAMADYAQAIDNVTTWDAFAAVVEAFPQSPDFLAAAGRSIAACSALEGAAAASGITVDLRCEGI